MVILNFKRMNPSDLVSFSSNVITRMTADPQFVGLKPQTDALKLAYDAFLIASSAADLGGKDRILERDTRKQILLDSLDILAKNVDIIARDKDEIVMAAGFEIRKARKIVNNIETPTGLAVLNTERSGAVRLSWNAVEGAVDFAIEHFQKDKNVWENGQHSTKRDIVLTGFAPGSNVDFRVRAFGRRELASDWSSAIGIWVS